jgi:hypothetical protein
VIVITQKSCPCLEHLSWRVVWPEPDGSQGEFTCQTCELAVEHALLIRTLIGIQRGRDFPITISDTERQDHCPAEPAVSGRVRTVGDDHEQDTTQAL